MEEEELRKPNNSKGYGSISSTFDNVASRHEKTKDSEESRKLLTSYSTSNDSEESSTLASTKLPPLTRRQILTIIMLAFANLCSTVVISCIAPFFPNEAARKGATETEVGLIFGMFELTIVLTSPIFGMFLTQIGVKFMYSAGLLTTSTTIILFGLLNKAPDGTIFVVLCFVVRIIEAMGDSAYATASLAIVAHEFPGRVALVIGWLETFVGLGYTAGPAIGGALYQAGGYITPFMTLGSLLFLACLLSIPLIPKQTDHPKQETQGLLGLLRLPAVLLYISAAGSVCSICFSFLSPTLEPFLNDFNLSPIVVGLMFLLVGGVYTMTAPLWGIFINKTNKGREVMILGALCGSIAMFFLGPSPLLGIEKNLWVVGGSQVVLGLGIGALFIPAFKSTLDKVLANGYEDNFQTHGLMSGLFNGFFHLGGFIGPTLLGGVLVDAIGFAWSTTVLAGLNMVVAVALLLFRLYGWWKERPHAN